MTSGLTLACGGTSQETTDTSDSDLIAGRVGAVYTMSNDADANQVLVYRRANDGSLQAAASYGTTGKGTGAGLGSQGAVVLSQDRHWLFVVNAGSNELSVFRVHGESLYLVDTEPTGGIMPVSVTENGGLIYVVHAGGTNNVTGFYQRNDGSLVALSGSTRALSAASVGPAEVAFGADGRAIFVTEKGTNSIDEFTINPYSGLPGKITTRASNGQTPFGFAVTRRNQLVVSEAFGGGAGASALSSYQVASSPAFRSVSDSIADTQTAACWVALAKNDRFAFTTNTGSGSISTYSVATDGTLALLGNGDAADTGEGSKPADVAVSYDQRFLYVLDGGTAALSIFSIANDGALTALPGLQRLARKFRGNCRAMIH